MRDSDAIGAGELSESGALAAVPTAHNERPELLSVYCNSAFLRMLMPMDRHRHSCPLSQQELIDEFFIEHRVHVLEIAAFLDRMDRAADRNAEGEFRYTAFKRAVAELVSTDSGRVERVQMILSDRDVRLLEERDQQSAWGAPRTNGTL